MSMIYQPTDEEMEDPVVERWTPISSVSRGAPVNYVPAAPSAPAPLAVPPGWGGVATVELQPVDVSGVMEESHDGSRDSTSATDRAWGYNIRLLPALLVCLLLAGMGTLAFVLIMRYLRTPTDGVTNLFAFLLFVGVGFLMFAVSLNRTDYAHSRAGVRRHQITTAAELRKSEIAAMLELRREALRHTLQLLDSQRREDA